MIRTFTTSFEVAGKPYLALTGMKTSVQKRYILLQTIVRGDVLTGIIADKNLV